MVSSANTWYFLWLTGLSQSSCCWVLQCLATALVPSGCRWRRVILLYVLENFYKGVLWLVLQVDLLCLGNKELSVTILGLLNFLSVSTGRTKWLQLSFQGLCFLMQTEETKAQLNDLCVSPSPLGRKIRVKTQGTDFRIIVQRGMAQWQTPSFDVELIPKLWASFSSVHFKVDTVSYVL